MKRRQFLSLTGLFALPIPLLGADRKLTPEDVEGPFYPVKPIPVRSNLINGNSLKDQAVELSGKVLNKAGKPLIGAKIEIWQCDKDGIYDHPNQHNFERFDSDFSGYGAQITDEQGYYKFSTLYPAPYPGRPPHIHVKVWDKTQELLTTQLYLQGRTGSNWYRSLREPLQINPKQDANGKMKAAFTFIV